jgi:hypothetical protein
MESSDRRSLWIWFLAGATAPLVFYVLMDAVSLFDKLVRPDTYRFPSLWVSDWWGVLGWLAERSCPTWLFLWIPANSGHYGDTWYHAIEAAILLANACLYLCVGYLQLRIRRWRPLLRLATVVASYSVLLSVVRYAILYFNIFNVTRYIYIV